jgi:hypothetical protein
MQFFCYCRDRAGAAATRRALLPDHWAFMRQYKDVLIARGPTMSADGATMTGSMHMVELPDADAARVFAYDEPLAKGGVFEDIFVRRYDNVLGRTMWQFAGDPKNPRFLFIGQARSGAQEQGRDLPDAQRAYLGRPERAAQVILFGPLLGADGRTWEGTAMLLETPDPAAARALAQGDPAAVAGLYARADLYPWRFGGEENLREFSPRP